MQKIQRLIPWTITILVAIALCSAQTPAHADDVGILYREYIATGAKLQSLVDKGDIDSAEYHQAYQAFRTAKERYDAVRGKGPEVTRHGNSDGSTSPDRNWTDDPEIVVDLPVPLPSWLSMTVSVEAGGYLPQGGPHTLPIEPSVSSCVVQGKISDASSGMAVAGAEVSISGAAVPDASVRTGEDGRYKFTIQSTSATPGGKSLDSFYDIDLKRETIVVRGEAGDYPVQIRKFPLPGLVPPAEILIVGAVSDASTDPLEGATIAATYRGDTIESESDSSGAYSITIPVGSEGYIIDAPPVNFRFGQIVSAQIQVWKTGFDTVVGDPIEYYVEEQPRYIDIAGTVTDAGLRPEPLEDARIDVLAGDLISGNLVTGPDGNYQVRILPRYSNDKRPPPEGVEEQNFILGETPLTAEWEWTVEGMDVGYVELPQAKNVPAVVANGSHANYAVNATVRAFLHKSLLRDMTMEGSDYLEFRHIGFFHNDQPVDYVVWDHAESWSANLDIEGDCKFRFPAPRIANLKKPVNYDPHSEFPVVGRVVVSYPRRSREPLETQIEYLVYSPFPRVQMSAGQRIVDEGGLIQFYLWISDWDGPAFQIAVKGNRKMFRLQRRDGEYVEQPTADSDFVELGAPVFEKRFWADLPLKDEIAGFAIQPSSRTLDLDEYMASTGADDTSLAEGLTYITFETIADSENMTKILNGVPGGGPDGGQLIQRIDSLVKNIAGDYSKYPKLETFVRKWTKLKNLPNGAANVGNFLNLYVSWTEANKDGDFVQRIENFDLGKDHADFTKLWHDRTEVLIGLADCALVFLPAGQGYKVVFTVGKAVFEYAKYKNQRFQAEIQQARGYEGVVQEPLLVSVKDYHGNEVRVLKYFSVVLKNPLDR